MSWVLVERPWNKVRNLSQEEFQVLLLCDGETELDKDLLSELEQTLRQCEEKGWVENANFRSPWSKTSAISITGTDMFT